MWVTSRDGVRLNTEVHGPQDTREPTVVLIHGNTCSIPFWAPVIRALRGDLRLVRRSRDLWLAIASTRERSRRGAQ